MAWWSSQHKDEFALFVQLVSYSIMSAAFSIADSRVHLCGNLIIED
jgi:hypothetical protein